MTTGTYLLFIILFLSIFVRKSLNVIALIGITHNIGNCISPTINKEIKLFRKLSQFLVIFNHKNRILVNQNNRLI